MKLKLDENISRHLKSILNQKGHEARTAEDEGLLGKTDVEVGAIAKTEGRMLFTLDLEFVIDPGPGLAIKHFQNHNGSRHKGTGSGTSSSSESGISN
jgi:hypothetical protein